MIDSLNNVLPYILHIDTFLIAFVAQYGIWTYAVLFCIIFCETGLVVTPFLPGDSLIFAAGSIAANASEILSIYWLLVLLMLASILGNQMNYFIGLFIGPRIFHVNNNTWRAKLFNRKYLEQAHRFYEKHGGKTIILARFIPIIRTYAPFVAGISYMNTKHFTIYNILSATIWIGSLLAAGYFFGSLPFIQQNFSIVVYGIIAVSLLPPVLIFLYKKAVSLLYPSTTC